MPAFAGEGWMARPRLELGTPRFSAVGRLAAKPRSRRRSLRAVHATRVHRKPSRSSAALRGTRTSAFAGLAASLALDAPRCVGSRDRWPHPTELRIGVPSPGCAWCPGLRDRPALRCGARSRIGVAIPPPLCEGARERLPGAPADECSCGVATAPRRRRVRRRVPRGHVHWTRSTRVHPGAAGAAVAPDSRFEHGRM